MSPIERHFWLIWSPAGPTNPRQRHYSESEARDVCRAMAIKHPGQRFFVMKCECGYVAEGLQHIAIQEPF